MAVRAASRRCPASAISTASLSSRALSRVMRLLGFPPAALHVRLWRAHTFATTHRMWGNSPGVWASLIPLFSSHVIKTGAGPLVWRGSSFHIRSDFREIARLRLEISRVLTTGECQDQLLLSFLLSSGCSSRTMKGTRSAARERVARRRRIIAVTC